MGTKGMTRRKQWLLAGGIVLVSLAFLSQS